MNNQYASDIAEQVSYHESCIVDLERQISSGIMQAAYVLSCREYIGHHRQSIAALKSDSYRPRTAEDEARSDKYEREATGNSFAIWTS